MLLALLLACTQPISDTTDTDPVAPERVTTIGILADPHVTGEGEHADRLRAAVAWLGEQEDVELVLVLGDVAWGDGLDLAPGLLAELPVPWVPIIGDNEIQDGSEERSWEAFAPQRAALAASVPSYAHAAAPVDEPGYGPVWLDNASLDYAGVHVVMADLVIRSESGALGEFGTLHDYAGGTLPWLEADLDGRGAEPWILATHIPPHLGFLDLAELETLGERLGEYTPHLLGVFSGHVHLDSTVEVEELGATVTTVDDVWGDTLTVHRVEVWRGPDGWWLEDEPVVLPWP